MFIIDTQSGLLFTNAIWVNPRAFIKQLYYQYIYVTLLNALSTKVKKKSTQKKNINSNKIFMYFSNRPLKH